MPLGCPNMRRCSIIAFAVLAACQASCFLLKPKSPAYPTGLIFPLVEDSSLPVPGRITGGIREREGMLYFSTLDGTIHCLDGRNKKTSWEFKMDKGPFGPPTLGRDRLYAQAENGVIYCLSLQGGLLWKSETGEGFLTPAVEGGRRVFFGTDKGRLWSFDLEGSEAWRYEAGSPVGGGPFFMGSRVACGSDDGRIHFISLNGTGRAVFQASGRIVGPMASDGRLLFFDAGTRDFYGLSIARMKRRWKVRLNGLALVEPVIAGRRLYLLGANSVLYCLDSGDGDIVWWANIPSRKAFDLAIAGDNVVVSTPSALLLAFDARTGKKAGEFKSPADLRANAVWIDPFLLVSDYDPRSGEGKIRYLRKDVRVTLAPQKASPRFVGDEVSFTASPVGFFDPKFEFFIKQGGERTITRPESEKNNWAWYADKAGSYVIGVKVTDARQSMEAEIPFVIEAAKEKKPDGPAAAKPAKKEKKKK